MIRWLLWVLVGLILGGVVHLSTILAAPRFASRDAYSRFAAITPVNTVQALPPREPGRAIIPFLDPAFATSICRYDLSNGPMKLSVPVTAAYTAVSFYTRRDIAYYAINDRAAGRRVIELDLMTAKQRSQLPENEEITAADRLIVESPTITGLIMIKALATEAGQMPAVRAALNAARCMPQ